MYTFVYVLFVGLTFNLFLPFSKHTKQTDKNEKFKTLDCFFVEKD